MSFLSSLGRAAKKLAAPIGAGAGFLIGGPAGAAAGYKLGGTIGKIGGIASSTMDVASKLFNKNSNMAPVPVPAGIKPGPIDFGDAGPNPFDLSSLEPQRGGGISKLLGGILNKAGTPGGQAVIGAAGAAAGSVLDQRNTAAQRELDRQELARRSLDSVANRSNLATNQAATAQRTRQEDETYRRAQTQRQQVDPKRQQVLQQLMASFGGR